MYFVIPGESLTDPLALNDMRVIGLDVIKAPTSSKFPYWYEFVTEGSEQIKQSLQAGIKPGWYCACFDDKNVSIIFAKKIFDVIIDNRLTNQAISAQEYGKANGVQSEYLDWRERQAVYLKKLGQAKGIKT